MEPHTLILLFYVIASNGAQMTQVTLSDKYPDERACLDAGESMKYVNKLDAAEMKIGFVCVKNGTVEDPD